MMVSTGLMPSTASTTSSGLPSPTSETFDDSPNQMTMYLHELAGHAESEVNLVIQDHCYSRPWNWKPENVYVKPVKKLFFSKTATTMDNANDEIEIEVDDLGPSEPPYDLNRCRHTMDEFKRLAAFARPDEDEDWEENIKKILWTPVQNRIFTKVMRILSSERLARMAKANSLMEPIFRRTFIDTAARRFRETLASASWDWRITQWLHSVLFEHLPQEYLAIYLDILQTLRQKIPQLIDKMIAAQPNLPAKTGSITWETLGPMLKRSWDPVGTSLSANRPKKLPGNPILIVVPSGVGTSVSSRQHKWTAQLGTLGMVVNVHTHMGLAANRMTMMTCIDQLVQSTRTKVQDIRSDCPGRPIILIGFNTGAALACQVAQMEHVTAVICLGFPFSTVEGKRGTPDDTLTDIRCPVMFVIGQNATLVRADDIEDMRERMLVETSLVVVGTADDNLRISTAKKITDGITQSMVDRCILDEMADFVGSILLQPHPLPLRATSMANFENKSAKKESRKRKNSTSSSVESEPNSPIVKKTRPTTPMMPGVSGGQTQISSPQSIPRSGTLSTQPTLVAISTANVTPSSTPRRKPRVISSQKVNIPEQVLGPRLANQRNANPGITLNIGSLASLAPIGPLRLAGSLTGQTATTTTKATNASKSSASLAKVPRIMSTIAGSQTVPKLKAVTSANKNLAKVTANNYKNINVIEKGGGDAKLVNVLTTAGNQVRVSASTAAAMRAKSASNASGALSALLQSRRSPMGMVSGMPVSRGITTSSILLTPSISTTNTRTSSPSTSIAPKVIDHGGSGSSLEHPLAASLDASMMSEIASKTYPLVTSGASLVMLSDNAHYSRAGPTLVPISSNNPITIMPIANKLKLAQNQGINSMPKITVNSSSLQRGQRSRASKKNLSSLDDDLGNILDIPIIFAKDVENLNAIEKAPPPIPIDTVEKNGPKLSGTTKVVLISNKQDKHQQFGAKPPTQTVVRPTSSVQQGNPSTQSAPRSRQPTIKYTKIILAKRNSATTPANSEQVVLTKNTPSQSTSKMFAFEKNEHRYAQVLPRQHVKLCEILQDDALEIEDAIKTNIIERKILPPLNLELANEESNDLDAGDILS